MLFFICCLVPNQYGKQKISIKNNINSEEWNIRLINILFNKQDPMKSQIAYLDVVGKTCYYSFWCAQNSRWPIITWQQFKNNSHFKNYNQKSIDIEIIWHCPIHSLFSSLFRNLTEEYRRIQKERINEENEYKLYCCVMITFSMCYSETSLIHAKAKRETVSNWLSTFLLENLNDLRVTWNDCKSLK